MAAAALACLHHTGILCAGVGMATVLPDLQGLHLHPVVAVVAPAATALLACVGR
jgi:hypothetical protein